MGEESGEGLDRILARKELERRINGGLFVWGIGNGVGPGVRRLVADAPVPEVLFSPIRSRATAIDRAPSSVLLWLDYIDRSGREVALPRGSLVTSRADTPNGIRKRVHYGLFCSSDEPLQAANRGTIHFHELRNLTSKRRVGFSQVTAVVARDESTSQNDLTYQVMLSARLREPFCVQLTNAVVLDAEDVQAIEQASLSRDPYFWSEVVDSVKERFRADPCSSLHRHAPNALKA